MEYELKVFSISEIGKRANQEDSIYPALGNADDNDRLFVLCDGMGGHAAGEVASSTVCKVMSNYIMANVVGTSFDEDDFAKALSASYDALDANDNCEENKMGTTLTFLKFHDKGCFVAHIGDSRVYHIRPSEIGQARIVFVTRDHSLVNDLVELGELTPEQAKTSRQRNVITRAMQPNQERRDKADIKHITDIHSGDYFYMCSDGMLEQMDDMELADILSLEGYSDDEKMDIILEQTSDNKDNHSAHLIHVIDVSDVTMLGDKTINQDTCAESNRSRTLNKVVILLIFAIIVFVIFYFASDWIFKFLNK